MEGGGVVVDIIDNGGQWTHREWRMLRYLGVETQILPNTIPVKDLRDLDGLILSGGAARVGLTGKLGNCAEYLELEVPILGICAGHQFMARHYGGDAGEAPKPEFGEATIMLVGGGGALFVGTADEQTVWESHNDEVTELPPGFVLTARSESCDIQAMENEELARFGLQFHPEVNDTEFGEVIIENFVGLCRRVRKTN
ncbi:MAG TPA: GMP synthase subunit A [Candidatus Thalassarchaeaceae archaeon]|jgi:GMP synthase (glutamine-hydrolysing)|nr:GMP synthase subunit A [Candidatus Thalassarchaeaceae archaeon]